MKNNIDIELISATPIISAESSAEVKYVVVRNSCRVSDKEYISANDPAALIEKSFWKNAAKKEVVEIVVYNPVKHKIW